MKFLKKLKILPRHQYSSNHRWLSYSAERGRRIIIWLAIADLFGSLGVFARSSIWLNFNDGLNDEESQWSFIFCATSSVRELINLNYKSIFKLN